MRVTYSKDWPELVITDEESGQELWRGLPLGYWAKDLLLVPNSPDCIIRLERDAKDWIAGVFDNLIRINPKGEIIWRAMTPTTTSGDMYHRVWWAEHRLMAHSVEHNVELDPETGQIISKWWTK